MAPEGRSPASERIPMRTQFQLLMLTSDGANLGLLYRAAFFLMALGGTWFLFLTRDKK